MKLAIVGAGNIGSALVQCLAPHGYDIGISNPSLNKLERISEHFPSVRVSTDNKTVATEADVIFIAVKPHLVEKVLRELAPCLEKKQIIVSLAAGISTDSLAEWTAMVAPPVFRVIPNTAISRCGSMTFYCSARAERCQEETVKFLLDLMGKTLKIDEEKMAAFTSLSSCGIAYALRYIRAATEAAVEIGIKPDVAQSVICQTLMGAVKLLEDGSHPEMEIDKITTPGGLTIKGLNVMEANGFTTSVIEGLKASLK